MKKYIIGFLVSLTSFVSAFTFDFDFVGLNGTQISAANPLTINVAGYGNVIFTADGAQVIGISSNRVNINPAQTLNIYFDGALAPTSGSVNFTISGIAEADGLITNTFSARSYSIVAGNGPGADGFRLVSGEFTAVPEPSTAILGVTGLMALALRRRRA
jgi:hypothetical protein